MYRNIFNLNCYRAGDGQRQQWISAIEKYQQIDIYQSQIQVCELHFNPNSIKKRKDRNVLTKGTPGNTSNSFS